MHRKTTTIGAVALAMLVLAAGATASTRVEPNTAMLPTSGPNAINPKTCKFIHREKDVVVTDFATLKRYTLAEDARHDVKMNCNTNLLNHGKPGPRGPKGATGARGPAGPAGAPGGGGLVGYVQVKATGTGQTVTATCPSGDVVLGGGSPDETTGSWPSSTGSWSVARDHLSPRVLTVIATCAEVAS